MEVVSVHRVRVLLVFRPDVSPGTAGVSGLTENRIATSRQHIDMPTTPPTPRRPRLTKAEKQQRIDYVEMLVGRRIRTSLISSMFADNFGGEELKSWLKKAVRAAQDEMRRDINEQRAICYMTYKAIIADPSTSTRDKLTCNKNIAELLGLEAPKHVINTEIPLDAIQGAEELARTPTAALLRMVSASDLRKRLEAAKMIEVEVVVKRDVKPDTNGSNGKNGAK